MIGGLLTIQSAWADDSAKLVGTWKLIAFETEFQDGSPPRPIFGKSPVGYDIRRRLGARRGPAGNADDARRAEVGAVEVAAWPVATTVNSVLRCPSF